MNIVEINIYRFVQIKGLMTIYQTTLSTFHGEDSPSVGQKSSVREDWQPFIGRGGPAAHQASESRKYKRSKERSGSSVAVNLSP